MDRCQAYTKFDRMVLTGVQVFLHYVVGGMNDPVKFVFVTGYEVSQKISHHIV